VLGEMRELGEASEREHEGIGALASSLHIDRVVVVGDGAKPILVGTQGVWVADIGEAVALLTDELRPGDVVLVKASHSIGLERVAEALLSDGARS
jgi:UDP-N-acetylmuramoyl-tripeptide--D-alanyl-D-alanine ligase